MEKSLDNELYLEMLKQKGGLSVPDIPQSDLLDIEDEQWYEESSSWIDSNVQFDPSYDICREWERRKNQFHSIGYRDGIIAGKEASAQQGFNVGFKESVADGLNLGLVRGFTSALNFLPGELREKIIESQETRNNFHDLFKSMNNLSTIDALKLFSDDLINKKVKQGDKVALEEQKSDGSVLYGYYRRLESLIVESSINEVQTVQLMDKTINVSNRLYN